MDRRATLQEAAVEAGHLIPNGPGWRMISGLGREGSSKGAQGLGLIGSTMSTRCRVWGLGFRVEAGRRGLRETWGRWYRVWGVGFRSVAVIRKNRSKV